MAEAISEFFTYHHDCVWAAVLMAGHHLRPDAWPLSGADVDELTREAISYGEVTDSQGSATLYNLTAMLDKWHVGYHVAAGYAPVLIDRASLASILSGAFGAGYAVLLGMNNGQALHGDESGLQGHCIAVLHDAPNGTGYACGDGDNPLCITTGAAVVYTLDELVAAQAQSATIIQTVGVFPMSAQIPQGWHDNGQTLMAPNGVPVVLGFREWVLTHQWDADNYPLAPEEYPAHVEWAAPFGAGSRQLFRKHLLCYINQPQPGEPVGVYEAWVGANLAAVAAQLAQAPAATAAPDPKYQAAYNLLAVLAKTLASVQAGN